MWKSKHAGIPLKKRAGHSDAQVSDNSKDGLRSTGQWGLWTWQIELLPQSPTVSMYGLQLGPAGRYTRTRTTPTAGTWP